MTTRRGALLAVGLLGCGTTGLAKSPAASRVVLTITGKVKAPARPRPDGSSSVGLTLEILLSLPQHGFTTATPWFQQRRRFDGPRLSDVLDRAGAHGETLRGFALNEYRIDIPMSDVRDFDPILALRLDGKLMAIRDKGPSWIIYNFERHPSLQLERYYSRCIWQLHTLEVR